MWVLLSWAGTHMSCQYSTGLRQLVLVVLLLPLLLWQVLRCLLLLMLLQMLHCLLLYLRPPCLPSGPVAAPALRAPAAVAMAASCCLCCSCVS